MAAQRRYGSLLSWFTTREDKELRHECALAAQILAEVGEKKQHADLCRQYAHWLNEARQAIDGRPIDYDRAWSALLEIRHLSCRMLPPHDLDRIVLKVRDDLAYIPARAAHHRKQLDDIAKELKTLDQKGEHVPGTLRFELEHFSHLTADARLDQWYKINLYRQRLRQMALYMAGALAIVTLALILYPLIVGNHEPVVIFAVIGFGCLGGFLSALLTPEPLSKGSSAFYIERGLLLLRPTIGAVAGLVMYYLQKAEVVTIAKGAVPYVYYVAAFAAGFSERLFVTKVALLLGGGKEKSKTCEPDEG
jgi:hypothetical protein